MEGRWVPGAYVHFTLSERGKTRPIDAPRIQDRQVHKVFTKKVLLSLYTGISAAMDARAILS